MCSIFGYISKQPVDVGIFQRCLQHRGPDGNGIYQDKLNQLLLGHSRLSIIDLSTGANQPMLDTTETHVLVFNGEIYNYEEIRSKLAQHGHTFKTHSDTEALLLAYKQFGRECLNMFRGMFAFVLYDKKEGKLFMARDRFGIKPLYYTFHNQQFAFASEVTPLVESGIVPRKISSKALDDFFYFGSVKQPDTIYKDVFSLMPASWMIVDVKTLKHSTGHYYNFVKEAIKLPYFDISHEEAVRLVRAKLEEATKYHLVADVEVGAFLSGGVDSTAVVALMSKLTNKPIKTFSVGFARKTEAVDETALARQSATALGCDHTDVIVDDPDIPELFNGFIGALDQPSVDGFNTFIVSKAAAKQVKVVLSGLGGDEIFAGYEHFKVIQESARKVPTTLERTMQWINRMRPNKYTSKVAYFGQDPSVSAFQERTLLSIAKKHSLIRKPELRTTRPISESTLSPLQKISAFEVEHYLRDTLLRDSDVMSMAHSLECRPILLDHVLMETAFCLPDDLKIRNGVKKAIFIDAVKDLIPSHVYERKKSGFEMPVVSWMNQALKANVLDALSSNIAKQLFTGQYLQRCREELNQGQLTRAFWQNFVLLQWLNQTKATL